MDSVGHGATRHPTKINRKEDGKVTEKETAREPRRVASPKEEKAEFKGKEKVYKKRQRLTANHRTSRRAVNKWILGMLKQTLRVVGKIIGTQQIRILKHQQPLRNFNMLLSVNCDFRILVFQSR